MHIARASEKMMKSKLLLRGTNPDWIHDQVELMLMLGFSEEGPLMYTAAQFSTFAVNSNVSCISAGGCPPRCCPK